MLEQLLSGIAEITLGASAVILLLLLLTPVLRKSFAAKWRYWAWLLLALRLAVPFNLSLPSAPVRVPAPPPALTQPLPLPAPQPVREDPDTGGNPVQPKEPPEPFAPAQERGLSFLQITALAWLAGALAFLLWQFISYGVFLRSVRRWSRPAENPVLLEKLQLLRQEMHIRKRIPLLVCRRAGGPMLTGFFRPRILLPREDWEEEAAEFILRHELTHWRRHDLWYKLLLTLAAAIHWFNPLVWVMRRQADRDVEISCDDAVLRGADFEMRGRYSDAILAVTRRERRSAAVFSTFFKGTKRTVKQRFANIFDLTKKHRGVAALCVAGALALLSGGLVACSLAGESGTPAVFSGGDGEVELTAFLNQTEESLSDALGEPEEVMPLTGRAEWYNYEDGGLWFTLFDGRVSAVNLRFERADSRYRLCGIGVDSAPGGVRALKGEGAREEDGRFTLYLDGNRCEFAFEEEKAKSAAVTYRPEEPSFPLSLGISEFSFADGSRVSVELRMTDGQIYRSSDAGYAPGGNIQGDETYDGSFELVTRKEGKEQAALPLEGGGFNFHGPVALEGRDYIGDGSLQFTVGAWAGSSLTDFSLYRLDSGGGLTFLQTITANGPGQATALFSPAPGGFTTSAYNNADGKDSITLWVWDGTRFTEADGLADEPYVYPVGVDTWKNLHSYEERAAVCRVPEEVMEKLSTPALLETALTHPMLLIVYAQNSCADVQRAMRGCVNTLSELEARPGAASLMFEKYRELCGREGTGDSQESLQEKMQTDFLECFLVEMPFYSALRQDERTELGRLIRGRQGVYWIHGVREELEAREAEAAQPENAPASPIQLERICGGPAKDDLAALLGQPERTEETETGVYQFYPFVTVCLQNGNVAGIQVEYPGDWEGTGAQRYQVLGIGPADSYKDVTEKLDIAYAGDLNTVPTFQSYPWHDGFMAWFFYDRETGRVRAIQVGLDDFLFSADAYFSGVGAGHTE